MINIKTAAAFVAAVATVGVSAQQILRARKSSVSTEQAFPIASSSFAAFNKAQDVITERMLAGYYDDKPDAEAQYDFHIMYNNYLIQD